MRSKYAIMAGALTFAALLSSVGVLHVSRAHADPPVQAPKPATNEAVIALFKQATQAYAKFKSYQHSEVFTISQQAKDGEHKQSQKVILAFERPNKFAYRVDHAAADAVVSDGKTFIKHRAQLKEYVKTTAPAAFKDFAVMDEGLFPQATYLTVLALRGDILGDPFLAGILTQAKVGPTADEGGKPYYTLVIQESENSTLTFSLDANTHLLHKITRELKTEKVTVTELLEDVQTDKAIDPSVFTYTPPVGARQVTQFSDPQAEAEKAQAARYEGKPAPDFTVLAHDGKEVKLSAMKGKIVVVDFWASWCGPCKAVMPIIQEIHDKYKDKGVTVMAVDTWDARMDCEEFLAHNSQYTMPVLLDPAGKEGENSIATKKYGVDGIPTTLFIDKTGVVRKYAIGAHPSAFYLDTLKEMGVQVPAK